MKSSTTNNNNNRIRVNVVFHRKIQMKYDRFFFLFGLFACIRHKYTMY